MPPILLGDEPMEDLLRFFFSPDAAQQNKPPTFTPDGFAKLRDDRGYPGVRPPWGTLTALDLSTGRIVWQVPLGEHEELTKEGMPKTGTMNYGGATVTAGGLIFCAGTLDLKIRAFDADNGVELWSFKLPFGGFAPPAIYQANGRQFVVIAATGGGKLATPTGDAYMAFALPK
jgi:quinoprotein glucose dehydrogenase